MNQVLVAHDRDANKVPGNIKDGITIDGVLGTLKTLTTGIGGNFGDSNKKTLVVGQLGGNDLVMHYREIGSLILMQYGVITSGTIDFKDFSSDTLTLNKLASELGFTAGTLVTTQKYNFGMTTGYARQWNGSAWVGEYGDPGADVTHSFSLS